MNASIHDIFYDIYSFIIQYSFINIPFASSVLIMTYKIFIVYRQRKQLTLRYYNDKIYRDNYEDYSYLL